MILNTWLRVSRSASTAATQLQTCARRPPQCRWKHHEAHTTGDQAPRVAVIGSGPAGFYTAQKVMREIHGTKVDMFEQLPVPFGLVRFGVAPDHPEVKNCQDTFTEVAASPDFTFIGNVTLGHDLPLPLLAKHYDAIVFAYGASKDRKIGLQGEDRPHIYSARAFVGWYNGLPEYRNLNPDLTAGETAIVVGQGNVALDVARALLSNLDDLKKTDMTEYALQALSASKIKRVHVVGRRGPLQAAFTIKEVRELLQLKDVSFVPIPAELFPSNIASLPRPKRRLMELLQKGSPDKPSATKSWSLDFCLAPKELIYSAEDGSKLEGVAFAKTKLENPDDDKSKVSATDEIQAISTSTLFRSIGYKAEPIPGMEEIGANFDDRKGTIEHDGLGRIVPLHKQEIGNASLYCSGWVKRGPTGVIASTMTDAFQTAEAIVADWKKKASDRETRAGWDGVRKDAKDMNLEMAPVYWENWQTIDKVEKENGFVKGKPREKFGTVEELLDAADARV